MHWAFGACAVRNSKTYGDESYHTIPPGPPLHVITMLLASLSLSPSFRFPSLYLFCSAVRYLSLSLPVLLGEPHAF